MKRHPWNGFPEVIRNADLGDLKTSSFYEDAKKGCTESAVYLIEEKITDGFIKAISDLCERHQNPVLLPVLALESQGENKIPLLMALKLSDSIGVPVELNVVQSSKAFRTNSGADHRLAIYPSFEGDVNSDAEYLILDDTLTMGGTIASMRSYIMEHGATVIGAAVMTAHVGVTKLPVSDNMLTKIVNKHGQEMFDYWLEEFGYEIKCLTQGEAGHLRAARSVVEIRDRIAEARVQHLRNNSEGYDPEKKGESKPGIKRYDEAGSISKDVDKFREKQDFSKIKRPDPFKDK